ncbi:nuclear transport factor 2 family protein [Sphingobium estronivorans]|uniref:nuclear transport factor 2 family protein n=1 Tax=Sphingobium estronivorans TaxID=1577690 RepID=UPI0013C35744|nr:nuclear transport factor 2 family protein [Sphingobium estronivorans]
MPSDVLGSLLAEREIRQQLYAACRAQDRLDLPLLLSVWHEGGTWDDEVLETGDPVVEVAGAIIGQLGASQCHAHHLSNVEIVVDGDRAVSRCDLSAVRRSAMMVDSHDWAQYLDQWSRRDGRWAIDGRRMVGREAWTQPVEDGGRGERSRRDLADPVYALFAFPGSDRDEDAEEERDRREILIAEREILRQLNRYCRGIDRFDVELWKSVWHDDATLDYESGQLKGRAMAMAVQMTLGHDVYAAHSHQIMNPTIRIKGDRAVSETCAHAVLRGYPDRSGMVTDSHYRGRYLDRWSCRDGRWAIDHRTLTEELMWNQSGHGRMGHEARRDREDPSYRLFASVEGGEGEEIEQLSAERAIRAQIHAHGRAERHQIGNILIVVDGDRAVSETGAIILRQGEAEGNGRTDDHCRGRYLDRWAKRDGGWTLDQRRFVEDFMWYQTVESAAIVP